MKKETGHNDRKIALFLIGCVTVVVAPFFLSSNADSLRDALRICYEKTLQASSISELIRYVLSSPVWATLFALSCAFLTPAFMAAKSDKANTRVKRYRFFEEHLVNLGYIDLDDILNYHSQFKWSEIGALAFGALFIGVTFTVEKVPDDPESFFAMYVALLVLVVSSTMLLVIGVVHINSQTPLLPIRIRFTMIDSSVVVGGLGTILTLMSATIFLSLIDTILTYSGAISFIMIYIFLQNKRVVKYEDLKEYFRISDSDWGKIQDAIFSERDAKDIEKKEKTVLYRSARDSLYPYILSVLDERIKEDASLLTYKQFETKLTAALENMQKNGLINPVDFRCLRTKALQRYELQKHITEASKYLEDERG